RFWVDGCVESRLSIPRPDNGLMIKRGAVAGVGFSGVVGDRFCDLRDLDECGGERVRPAANARAEIVGGIFSTASDRHLHDHRGEWCQDEHQDRTNDTETAIYCCDCRPALQRTCRIERALKSRQQWSR